MKLLFMLMELISADILQAQTSAGQCPHLDTNFVCSWPEIQHFPGGDAAFQEYFQMNTQYPDAAKIHGHEGTVYISFVVQKDGSITDVHAVKGPEDAPELAKEAERVIKEMPQWTPGDEKISMAIPIRFTLDH